MRAASGPYAAELRASSPKMGIPAEGPTCSPCSSQLARGRPIRMSEIGMGLFCSRDRDRYVNEMRGVSKCGSVWFGWGQFFFGALSKTFPGRSVELQIPRLRSGLSKGRGRSQEKLVSGWEEQQVPPLRYASVGMNLCLGTEEGERTILLRVLSKTFQDGSVELQIPRLRSPGFPVGVGGFVALHAPFPYRKAHTRPSPAKRGRKSGSG